MFDSKFGFHLNAVTIYILQQIKIEAIKIMASSAEIWQHNVKGNFCHTEIWAQYYSNKANLRDLKAATGL